MPRADGSILSQKQGACLRAPVLDAGKICGANTKSAGSNSDGVNMTLPGGSKSSVTMADSAADPVRQDHITPSPGFISSATFRSLARRLCPTTDSIRKVICVRWNRKYLWHTCKHDSHLLSESILKLIYKLLTVHYYRGGNHLKVNKIKIIFLIHHLINKLTRNTGVR